MAETLPSDAMAVWLGRPVEGGAAEQGPIGRLGQLLNTGRRMGLIPRQGEVLADVLATLPLLGRHAHAVALLDVQARPLSGGGYRLAFLQAALVLRTEGDNENVGRRIQEVLNGYTVETHSRLIEARTEDGVSYVRLIDNRLPEWCVIEWGVVAKDFVVAIGQGAFARMADAAQHPVRSLAHDAWFRRAHERCHGRRASLEVFVDVERIERRLSSVVRGRPREVLERLALDTTQHILVTSGRAERAVTGFAMIRHNQKDEFLPLSDPNAYSARARAAVPESAGTYTVLSFPIGRLLAQAWEAYVSSQRPHRRESLQRDWRTLQAELGIDIESQLFEHLGDDFIIHTFPSHPLGVPILFTYLIEIRAEPATVRRAMDGLLSAWQRHLEALNPLQGLGLHPQLHRADDGVWFIQAGIYGPGLAVTDRWIVLSFSPEAVRANVEWLESSHRQGSAGTGASRNGK